MCLSSPKPAAPVKQTYYTSQGRRVQGDPGLPQSAIDAGITTTAGYQAQTQQNISDQQIAAQKDIANQQTQFNQQQLAAMQDLQNKQQQAATDQANRQTTYDAGRSAALSDATTKINNAFAAFSPDYFNKFAQDYMSQANDQINYQRQQANKSMLFGLSRQGLSDSQELANATGLLDEAQGRAVADQTGQAQAGAASLQSQIAQARQNLVKQVADAQSIGSPIAGGTLGDVQSQLNTQQNAITGITSGANDVVSKLNAIPQVSSLGSIFSGVLGNLGSYIGGVSNQNALSAYRAGLSGTSSSPGGSTSVSKIG